MSFPRFDDYKCAGCERLGQVPNHWDVVPCRAIVEQRTAKNEGGKISDYLSLMANVGIIRYEDKGDIGNKKPDDLSKCKIVRRGDLVINSMNYGIGSYGLSPLDGVCSPVYIVLHPIPLLVSERFALRIFEEKEFQAYAQSFGNGILVHRSAISWDDLKNIKLGLPPLAEQAQIAHFLDHETARIDALIEQQQRLIELLKEKRQAVTAHAVTKGLDPTVPMKDSGVEWLGEVPAHWSVAKLSFRFTVELGKMLDEKKITGEHLVPYLRNRDVQWGVINMIDLPLMDISQSELDRYSVSRGDLLVCEGGEVGRSAIWQGANKEIGYQKALHRLRPLIRARDSSEFLYYTLFSAVVMGVFAQSEAKATIAHLPAEQFRQYRFPFPPMTEQIAIAQYLKEQTGRVDEMITASFDAVRLLNERRSSLISAAVTGKIDLRNRYLVEKCPVNSKHSGG